MNRSALILLLCFSLFVVGNAQPRKKTMRRYGAEPEWVTAKPQGGDYYIGISSAVKQGKSPDAYMAAARQNALADLAAAISTKMETSSTLYTLENTQQFGYNFSNDIKAATTVDLEGYELMGTWEDDNNYWVYYRLSRAVYSSKRAEKKRIAILKARDDVEQAAKMLSSGSGRTALMLYCGALAMLKPYLGESTFCTLKDGSETDIGILIYSKITDILNSTIVIPENGVALKHGIDINGDELSFKVISEDGIPLKNIPIKIFFSASGLNRPTATTGQDGVFACPIKRIKSSNSKEKLTFSVDVSSLAREITDEQIRMLVKNFKPAVTTVDINLINPKLSVNCKDDIIAGCARENLTPLFEITQGNADFEISITKNITFTEQGKTLFANVVADFVIYNTKKEIVYRKKFQKEISGTDRKVMQAQGVDEICKAIERSLKQEIARNIF